MKKLISGTWTNDKYGIYERNAPIFENTTSLAIYSDGTNIDSYEFYGNCSQASTPTPTVPVEVEEFGDKTVNLYDDSTTMDGYRMVWSTGAPYADANAATSDYIPVTPNTTYIARHSQVYMVGYDSTYTYLGAWTGSTFVKSAQSAIQSITVPEGCAYIKIVVLYKSILHTNFMFNSGSTALPYEPYGKYKIPITSGGVTNHIILSEPLRKIGGYADSVDSEGVVTRRIKKLVFDGTESWEKLGDSYIVYISNYQFGSAALSTHYAWNKTSVLANEQFSIVNDKVFIRDDSQSTLADFTTFLAQQYTNGTPVTVYYVLATPTTENVTAPTIPTSSGYSNIEIGTSLAPSKVELDMGKMFVPHTEKVRVNGAWT